MSRADEFPVASNPFSTRFTRPGALPYHFAGTHSAAELIEQFLAQGRRGQIVGPHGSGKSTLLATLVKALEQRGLSPALFTLHDGQSRLPRAFFTSEGDNRRIVIIDGYEQLGRWHRWRMAQRCRRRDWGLLVTCHQPLKFPVLYQTGVDISLALWLVRELLPPGEERIRDEDVRTAFQAQDGNLRETFFALYDDYEARRAARTLPGR
jgi:energy-coupling factor transporter ATP-binding protein EcfA2